MQTAGGCTSRALHLTSMPPSCLHGLGWLQPADTQQAVSCTGGAAACQSTFIHSFPVQQSGSLLGMHAWRGMA